MVLGMVAVMFDRLNRIARRLSVTREELERFDVALELVDIDLQQLGSPDSSPVRTAGQKIERAKDHREGYELEAAWTSLKAAAREMLHSSSTAELVAEAQAVCREASAKITGWRCDSVKDLLATVLTPRLDLDARVEHIETILRLPPPRDESGELIDISARVERAAASVGFAVDADGDLLHAVTQVEDALGWPVSSADRRNEVETRVIKAKEIVDEQSNNVYRKFRLLRKNVIRVSWYLAGLLAIVLIVVAAGWIPEGMAESASPLDDWKLLVATMTLGALGGILSGAIEIRSGNRKLKIPELRTYYTLTWMRPIVGAAGAVIVIIVLQSDLIGAVELSMDGMLPLAIVAGFTERLVTKTVSSAAAAVER